MIFLFLILVLQAYTQPLCLSQVEKERLVLTQSQTRLIALQKFIIGFNLTFSLSILNTNVVLENRLNQISTMANPCSLESQSQIELGVELDEEGRWLQNMGIMTKNQNTVCIIMGKLNENNMKFRDTKTLYELENIQCINIFIVSQSDAVIHCYNGSHSIFLLQNGNQVRVQAFELQNQILDSKISQNEGIYQIYQISRTQLTVYNISQQLFVQQMYRFGADDFQKQNINLTDLFIANPGIIVLSDFNSGFYRFSVRDGNIVDFEWVYYNTTVKQLSQVSSTNFYFLSDEGISEVLWIQQLKIVRVYQIPQLSPDEELELDNNIDYLILRNRYQTYVYKKEVTNWQMIEAMLYSNTTDKVIINPQINQLIRFKESSIELLNLNRGTLKITNSTQSFLLTLSATSFHYTQSKCSIQIQIVSYLDSSIAYATLNSLAPSYKIEIGQSLKLNLGDFFYGLNLSYQVTRSSNLTSRVKQYEKMTMFSLFSRKRIISVHMIDDMHFYRVTSEKTTFFIEKCSQGGTDITCLLWRAKQVNAQIVKFKIQSNSMYEYLFTYMLFNSSVIYIQNVGGLQFNSFVPQQTSKLYEITDYAISEEYLFVTRGKLSRIDIYNLDFLNYTFKQSITNSILGGNKLFKPRDVEISHTHREIVYIKNINSVIIVHFSGSLRFVAELPCSVDNITEQWILAHSSQTVLLIYGTNNYIEQYSILSINLPVFLKKIPLSIKTALSSPIRYTYYSNLLTIAVNNADTTYLYVVKTGRSLIQSILIAFPIDNNFVNFVTVLTDQLLIFYQLPTLETFIKRVYVSPQLEVVAEFINRNELVQSFPFSFNVISLSGDSTSFDSILTIINYEKQLKVKSYGLGMPNLPYSTDGLLNQIDDSDWYQGPVCGYEEVCDYCQKEFNFIYHFKKQREMKLPINSISMLREGNNIWVLSENAMYLLNQNLQLQSPPLTGIPTQCSRILKRSEMILLSCSSQTAQPYFLPIVLSNFNYVVLDPIYPEDTYIENVLSAQFISDDRFLVLDNDLHGSGNGNVTIFRMSITQTQITIYKQFYFDYKCFGLTDPNNINDIEIFSNQNHTLRAYFTLEHFGLAVVTIYLQQQITFSYMLIDLLQNPEDQFSNYCVADNSIFQIGVISTNTCFNDTHMQVEHTAILTTAIGAHFQLNLKFAYQIQNNQWKHVSTWIIQAFNKYGNQMLLNWLRVLPLRSQTNNNMFLIAYLNVSKFSISVSIYPLSSNTSQKIQKFQNLKGAYLMESNTIDNFDGILYYSDGSVNLILNTLWMDQQSRPLLFSLNNKIQFEANYNRPPGDKTIRFYARNDYKQVSFTYKIIYDPAPTTKWYIILIVCSGVVGVLIAICMGYRRYRLKKENQKKQSLLSEQQIE